MATSSASSAAAAAQAAAQSEAQALQVGMNLPSLIAEQQSNVIPHIPNRCTLHHCKHRKRVNVQECRSSLSAAKAEVVRLRRAVAVEKQRADGAAGDVAALAAELVLRQGAEAAAQGAKVALAAKADLVKDLRARVRR